jgi:hypothetical protein
VPLDDFGPKAGAGRYRSALVETAIVGARLTVGEELVRLSPDFSCLSLICVDL